MKVFKILLTPLVAVCICLVLILAVAAAAQGLPIQDEHTVALWLFDETQYPNVVLTDAGPYWHDLRLNSGYAKWWLKNLEETDDGRWYIHADPVPTPPEEPLHLQGDTGLVPGKFGNAVRFPLGQGGEVRWPNTEQRYGSVNLVGRPTGVPERLNLGYLDWTMEFWFKPVGDQSQRAALWELRNEGSHPRVVKMVNAFSMEAGRNQFALTSTILDEDPEREFDLEIAIPTDSEQLNRQEWSHLAFTYNAAERQLRHYVNGRLQPLPDPGGFLPMMGKLVSLRLGEGLQGLIDEFRISDIIRYTYEFTPPGSFSRNYGTPLPRPYRANGPPLLVEESGKSGVFELGSRKHVLIDEVLIEEMEGVRFTVNPPLSWDVTDFQNTEPWEPNPRMGSTIPDVCSVWDAGSEIHMLYTNAGMWGGKPHVVCFAGSKDGIHWKKPRLGLEEWEGSRNTNIVLRNSSQGSVIKDLNPSVSPEERLKYVGWNMYWGLYTFTSPDGIHWRRNEVSGLPFDPDGSISYFWDDQAGFYRGYIRALFETGVRRRVARVVMPDLLQPWPFEQVDRPYIGDMKLARPISGELPLVDTGGQVYRFKAHKYEWAPDVYLAFPWRFIGETNVRPGSFVMTSRNGEEWKRYEEPYYFPSGWDMGGREVLEALTEHGMIRRGDEIWMYGTARFTEHGGVLYGGAEHEGGIHDRLLRLVQRLDGFVSLDTVDEVGTVVTRPLSFEGNSLELNISASGDTRVALIDLDGEPFQGFSLDDCDPICADSVRHRVTWGGQSDLSSLAGKVVRLRFELQDSKLFAFEFLTR